MTTKKNIPIHTHRLIPTTSDDRVRERAAQFMTPQEKRLIIERERYARQEILVEDFKAALASGDFDAAVAVLRSVLRDDERALLWHRTSHADHLALLRACPEALDVMRSAIGPGAAENLEIDLLDESELPDVLWVSGPLRLTTDRFRVTEREAHVLQAAGLTVTAKPVSGAAHREQLTAKQAPAVKFAGLTGEHQMPGSVLVGDIVKRDRPQYEYTCEGYAFARIEAIPKLVEREVVEILLARDPEFRARSTIEPATEPERRREAKQRAQRAAVRKIGALGGVR